VATEAQGWRVSLSTRLIKQQSPGQRAGVFVFVGGRIMLFS
jgi:hypothetical protein